MSLAYSLIIMQRANSASQVFPVEHKFKANAYQRGDEVITHLIFLPLFLIDPITALLKGSDLIQPKLIALELLHGKAATGYHIRSVFFIISHTKSTIRSFITMKMSWTTLVMKWWSCDSEIRE